MSEQNYWILRINKPWVKRGALTALVLLILYALTIPMICDYSDRTRASEMLSVSSGVKQQVGEFILANPGKPVQMNGRALIPEMLSSTSKEGERMQIAFREITQSGEIRLFSPQLGVMLVLTPSMSGRQVKWECWGRSEKKVPANCRLRP
ncbi:MAG: pilin [Pseudomonadota bacterium]